MIFLEKGWMVVKKKMLLSGIPAGLILLLAGTACTHTSVPENERKTPAAAVSPAAKKSPELLQKQLSPGEQKYIAALQEKNGDRKNLLFKEARSRYYVVVKNSRYVCLIISVF